MTIQEVIFYLFAGILLFSAARVVTVRHPVHAALYLVLAFFTAAAIWLTLEAEFLAITLVLVYVGAVMVLFLFVVMMLDINFDLLREGFWKNLPLALMVAMLMAAEMALVLSGRYFDSWKLATPNLHEPGYSNTKELGRLLYTEYVYPFEIAAVVLLVAMVAAISLTLRKRKDTRFQNPSDQVAVKRNDRLRIIPVKADTKLMKQTEVAEAPEGAGQKS
ncbi:MAG: NADH-quinone oxidoreductase subunit J [Sulfuricellaceae bacterium]|nr:NADH-quinone oxidoreductase subunit J [Sulfuricellaceae bacterium]